MMRSLTKTTALVCVAAMTSGCGPTKFGRASIAEDAQAQMIGLTKQEVLYCAGIPERVTQYGGIEYLQYSHWYVRGNDGDTDTRNCDVTISLSGGRVSKVDYRGDTGGLLTQGESCYYIVKDCVQ